METSQTDETCEVSSYPSSSETTPILTVTGVPTPLATIAHSSEGYTASPTHAFKPAQLFPSDVDPLIQPIVSPAVTPQAINPLTGLIVSDPSKLERRPIAIKISNYPRSVRPQSGLSLADIVYEYYLEQNVTRFMAIFYGNDADKVGPVRSGRFFDEYLSYVSGFLRVWERRRSRDGLLFNS